MSEVGDPDFWNFDILMETNWPMMKGETSSKFRRLAHESWDCFTDSDEIFFHRNECSWTQYYTKRTNEGINQTNSKQINPLRSSESQTKTIPESSHWLYFFLRHSRSSTKPCRSLILLYVKRTRQVRLVRYLVNSPKSLSISHRVHKLPWNCHHPEMQYSYHSLTSTIENTLIAA